MYNNLQDISLYQNALLNALNVSAKVQATLPKELMDAAYIIYELQKVYAATPEGQQKNQLALAISEGSRILLSEINNMPIKQVQNITPPPPPTARVFQVGDMIRQTNDTDEIPLYVWRINSISSDELEFDVYKTDVVQYPIKKILRSNFTKNLILENLNDNYFSDYDPIKVGDVYKQVVDTNVPPKILWNITKVDKINNNLEFDITFSDPNISKADGSLNIIQYLQTIKSGIYEKYNATQNVLTPPPPPPTPPTPPPPPPPPTSRSYKVGDKFKESDDREVPPIYIYTITEINDVDDTVTFTLFRRNTNTTVTNTEDSSDWELYLSNGELVPYVEPTTITPPPPPTTPKRYKVGDKFRDGDDMGTPPTLIYTINEIDTNSDIIYIDIFDTQLNDTTRFVDIIGDWDAKLENGELVKYIEPIIVTPPTPPPPKPTTPKSYKVGDKFIRESDKKVPPEFIYEIYEIDNDNVTYSRLITKDQTLDSYVVPIDYFEDKFKNNKWIPYVESIAPPPPPPPPKPKKPKPPKPPISNPPVVNFSCKEIKDAIKGLTLLVSLGDDTVLDEINELKQLLKTQNCK